MAWIWNFLSVLVPFLFVLTVVVFVHELGHFLVARWNGVKVQVFSIGFGREVFGFNDRHGTRWRFAWIPLGGYVKFIDDDNGASMPSRDAQARMTSEEREGSFHSKSLGQRAAVVAAGPIANFLLAIVIFAGIFTFVGVHSTSPKIDEVTPNGAAARAGIKPGDIILAIDGSRVSSFHDVQRIVGISAERELVFEIDRGGVRTTVRVTPDRRETTDRHGNKLRLGDIGAVQVLPPRVGAVNPGSPADRAGLRPHDTIRAIEGRPINSFQDMQRIVSASADKPLRFEIERAQTRLELVVTPGWQEREDEAGVRRRIGVIGVMAAQRADLEFKRYDPITALWLGTKETGFVISRTLGYLKDIIVGRESADQLGGPIRIAEVSGQVASSGFIPLLNLTAILSVSIGLLNLFPIPLLDGGHLMFYAMEAIRRKPLSERAQEIGFRIGLTLVLMLMLYATFNDLPIVRKWIGLG